MTRYSLLAALALLFACDADLVELHPAIVITDPALADVVSAAATLWTDGTSGQWAAASITISDACPGDGDPFAPPLWCVTSTSAKVFCGAPAWGCTEFAPGNGAGRHITISAQLAADETISTVAHELAHAIGLQHVAGTDTLMDPERDTAVRRNPTIDAVTLAAFEAATGR